MPHPVRFPLILLGALAIGCGRVPIHEELDAGLPDASVEISDGGAAIVALTLNPPTDTVAVGGSVKFASIAKLPGGATQDVTADAVWASSDPQIATVSQGTVTAIQAGKANISASYQTFTAAATFTVSSVALVSIAVTPNEPSLAPGGTVQLQATGSYQDGSFVDLTDSAVWTASNPSAASVAPTGLVTAVAAGLSTVTATAGTIGGSTTVTVTAPTLTSITVTPAQSTIAVGQLEQLTATGDYSDGSSQNVTGSAIWISSSGAVSVSNAGSTQGIATGVSSGQATVTAILRGVKGTATVTVQ